LIQCLINKLAEMSGKKHWSGTLKWNFGQNIEWNIDSNQVILNIQLSQHATFNIQVANIFFFNFPPFSSRLAWNSPNLIAFEKLNSLAGTRNSHKT
jgi:hypothetical protein